MTWESLAVTALHIGKESSFHEDLEEYLDENFRDSRCCWFPTEKMAANAASQAGHVMCEEDLY